MDALQTVNDLVDSENFSDAVGTIDVMLPTFSPKTQDTINMANRLVAMLTKDNLKSMSGVLTDRDIQFLSRISAGLEVTDNGIKGSESGVRNRLQQIRDRIQSRIQEKQNEISSRYIGKSSSVLGRKVTQEDINFARSRGYTGSEIARTLGLNNG